MSDNPYLDELNAEGPSNAPAAANANPYLEALDSDQKAPQRQSNLIDATRTNPDEYARARQLEGATGVPAPVVQRNLPAVEERAKLDQATRDVESSPTLANHVADNPDFAKLASDDLGLLANLGNSFKRGWRALKQTVPVIRALDSASGLSQLNAIDRGEITSPDQLGVIGEAYLRASPEERKAIRANYGQGLAENFGSSVSTVANLEAQKRDFPQPASVGKVMSAKTFKEAVKLIGQHPLDFTASVGPESFMQSIPGMVAAVPAGFAAGPAGVMGAMGGNSYITDFSSQFLQELQDNGVDVSNQAALTAALQNPQLLQTAIDKAGKHAEIVGLFDALSGGIASKVAVPQKIAGRYLTKPLAREAANMAVQVPVQGALGAAGEAGGELNAGDNLQPGQVLAEAVGEVGGAPSGARSAGARWIPRQAPGEQWDTDDLG